MSESNEPNPDNEPYHRARPMADDQLSDQIFELIRSSIKAEQRQFKKGVNECMKAVHRDMAEIVVIAANSQYDVVWTLKDVCERQGIPYAFVPLSTDIGRACDVHGKLGGDCAACCITKMNKSPISAEIIKIQDSLVNLARDQTREQRLAILEPYLPAMAEAVAIRQTRKDGGVRHVPQTVVDQIEVRKQERLASRSTRVHRVDLVRRD